MKDTEIFVATNISVSFKISESVYQQSEESLPKSNNAGILPSDKQQFHQLVHTLQQMIPFLFASVIMSAPFANNGIGPVA